MHKNPSESLANHRLIGYTKQLWKDDLCLYVLSEWDIRVHKQAIVPSAKKNKKILSIKEPLKNRLIHSPITQIEMLQM